MSDDNFTGKISILDYNNSVAIMTLNGVTGELTVGGGWPKGAPGPQGHNGSISVKTNGGLDRVAIGGTDTGGIVDLYDATSEPSIMLNAENRVFVMRTEAKKQIGLGPEVIRLDAKTGAVSAGGNGVQGELALFPASVESPSPIGEPGRTIQLTAKDATAKVGGAGLNGSVLVLNKDGKTSITIDGTGLGDITLSNADCAEEFDVADAQAIEPGTVMVLDDLGRLRGSDQPYDPRVAGVISGARDYKPGIVLGKTASPSKRFPLALVGKVYCKVDAEYSPVSVGDLLTTSFTPGHAMKATDRFRAFGAVIGKALRPLGSGRDMIPILVALQ